ncbi:MAG: SOS response-associated peptidase [Candidatus Nitrosoglobus sp.]|jgi:putative SOS response-associated peptidase YedK
MCGRYVLHTSLEQIAAHFQLQKTQKITPRFNISPSQEVPVIRGDSQHRELAMLRWGLIPSWAKEEKTRYNMINARAETITTKPAFRGAFRYRRCLIPADGFYEWKSTASGKQPYYIRRHDGKVFAFAGLWEHWEREPNKFIDSCTIIVTDANDLIWPIHDRMPVILDPADYEAWLNPENQDVRILMGLLKPYSSEKMEDYPVSLRVNSPKNEDPKCILPLRDLGSKD